MISANKNQDFVQYYTNIIKNHHEYSFFRSNHEAYKKMIRTNDQQFLDSLIDQFSQKKIIYIRHAESPINVWVQSNPIKFMFSLYPTDPQLYNPGITEIGREQCIALKATLNRQPSTLHQSQQQQQQQQQIDDKLGCDNQDILAQNYDLVIVSPYQRTIATFDEVKDSEAFKQAKVVTSSLIRERASIPASVVGYQASYLERQRNDIDCEYLTQDKWWKQGQDNCQQQYQQQSQQQIQEIEIIKRESNVELQFRVLLFLIWITLREEKNIVFFSHCAVYEAIKLFKVSKPKNAIPYQITSSDFYNLYRQFFKSKPGL